jgi:hypothetical protein
MYIKKVFVGLKRRKQVDNLAFLVELKRKNKIFFNFLYAIKKLNFLMVILVIHMNFFILNNHQKV